MRSIWLQKYSMMIKKLLFGKIRNRLIVTFAFIFALTTAGIISIYYYKTTTDNKKEFINNKLKLLHQANNEMESLFKQIDDLSLVLFQEGVIWDSVLSNKRDPEEIRNDVFLKERLFESLMRIYRSNTNIMGVTLYVNKIDRVYIIDNIVFNDMFPTTGQNHPFFVDKPGVKSDRWYLDAVGNADRLCLSQGGILAKMKRGDYKDSNFTLSRAFLDPFTRRPSLLVSYSIDKAFFNNLDEEIKTMNENIIFVLPKSDVFIDVSNEASKFSNADLPLDKIKGKASEAVSFGSNNEYLALFDNEKSSGGYLMDIISYDDLNRNTKRNALYSILFGLGFFAIGCAGIVLLSVRISKPINKLARAMEQIEKNNINVIAVSHSYNEIGKLENSFNEMIQRINDLINREYKARLREKQARIETLQAKINPHFLNNTLQVISGIAIENHVLEIENIIKALSSILRYSLYKSKRFVTLGEEMENVSNYLLIQKYRYGCNLVVNNKVDSKLLDFIIPSLTIQPIVENSIIHGIERKAGKGLIEISVEAESENIFITVSDNGIGITENSLNSLNEEMENVSTDDETHGLRNVNARLKYYFGEEFRLKFESEPDKGTVVQVRLPIDRRIESGGMDHV